MRTLVMAAAVVTFLGLAATGAAAQDSDPGKSHRKRGTFSQKYPKSLAKHRKHGVQHRTPPSHSKAHRGAHHRKHLAHRKPPAARNNRRH